MNRKRDNSYIEGNAKFLHHTLTEMITQEKPTNLSPAVLVLWFWERADRKIVWPCLLLVELITHSYYLRWWIIHPLTLREALHVLFSFVYFICINRSRQFCFLPPFIQIARQPQKYAYRKSVQKMISFKKSFCIIIQNLAKSVRASSTGKYQQQKSWNIKKKFQKWSESWVLWPEMELLNGIFTRGFWWA
jgi:hypothetical protein